MTDTKTIMEPTRTFDRRVHYLYQEYDHKDDALGGAIGLRQMNRGMRLSGRGIRALRAVVVRNNGGAAVYVHRETS